MVGVSRLGWLLLAAVILGISARAEDWIEWPVSAGGNGHWYTVTPPVHRSGGDPWATRLEANLVSITTLEEDNFVRWDVAQGERAWIGLRGRRDNLQWSDGSPLTYMPGIIWNAPHWWEDTDYLFLNGSTGSVHWTVLFAVVHYGALLERTNSPYEGPIKFMGNLLTRQLGVTNIINGYFPDGATVEIRADIFGARPMALQWQLGGVNLPGQTNSILVVSNVVPNGSAYRLVASNSFGLASSEEFVLPVMPIRPQQGLSWFQWPEAYGGNGHWYGQLLSDLSVQKAESMAQLAGGHLASFSDTNELNFAIGITTPQRAHLVGLRADPGMPYEWTDGTPVTPEILSALNNSTGTNESSLSSGLLISLWDQYFVDHYRWSRFPILIETTNDPVNLLPVLKNDPPIGEGYSNGSAEFRVHALGPEPMSYQWKIDGVPILGETNAAYVMPLTTSSTGKVSVAVSNPNGTTESESMPVNIFQYHAGGSLQWAYWAPEIGGNGHWYASITDAENQFLWSEAEQFGGKLRASLLTIQDANEWEWLKALWTFTDTTIPLGLTDRENEGEFKWIDGTPFTFHLWTLNQPDSERADDDFVYGSIQDEWRTAHDIKFNTVVFERSTRPDDIAPFFLPKVPPSVRMLVGTTNQIAFEVIAGLDSSYLWYLNGSLVSTGTIPRLNLRPASTNESGLYQLIVRNAYGAATSAPVSVTVLDPIKPAVRMVHDNRLGKLEVHVDFPPDAERVEIEFSFDLERWTPYATFNAGQPTYVDILERDVFLNHSLKFFRVKRSF